MPSQVKQQCYLCLNTKEVEMRQLNGMSSLTCSSCYEHSWDCEGCAMRYTGDHYEDPDGERTYCNQCWGRRFFYCGSCDMMSTLEDAITGRGGTRLCRECAGSRTRSNNIYDVARDYQSTPIRTTDPGPFPTLYLSGLELECEDGQAGKLPELLPPEVGIQADGSLKGGGSDGAEIVTPPANGTVLLGFIEKSCAAAKAAGYGVSKNCGLHVHVEYPKEERLCKQLFETTFAVEDVLLGMLPDTRLGNKYCLPIRQDYTFRSKHMPPHNFFDKWYGDENRSSGKYSDTRYHGLNLHSVFYHGTVEWRYHSGTLDSEKIIYWTRIVQSICLYAREKFNEKEVLATVNAPGKPYQRIPAVAKLLKWPEDLVKYVGDRHKEFGYDRILWNPNLEREARLGRFLGREKQQVRAAFRRELRAFMTETPNLRKGLEDLV